MSTLYMGQDPRGLPAYTAADAARYLGTPASTIRSWMRGTYYTTKAGEKRSKPLITLPDPARPLLSFTNLVELHVLAAIRRVHLVSMPRVRDALDYLDRELGTPHPLARVDLQTDGHNLFIERFGELVSASGNGQVAMRDVLARHLDRIERDEAGVAARLYLFTRAGDAVEQPKNVIVDPRISFGRPVIEGTGVRTDIVVERYMAGESMEALAFDYGCDVAKIEDAVRCESKRAA